ncbi:nitroreductase/quinone reductase family protein [Mycobacteroides immunogenum]|uniref:Nitroreductase n=1 Tax=Mycobacteroides immunogenum TaxID=83262 RepID=A0A7V8LMM6_9MYCO|nr:nitroreductase/quinone reductase family protein [Mycobacteroides immunogenum]AMT72653.1 nitroreductase [Mycobacteroides immunogenum]ANO05816.1 nitroreductase [Mycobacteroides immunogenum]KIU41028.1 nitroreductase [Mycobacteroides immunogenum]KPG05934.1 nitroreductase [Mycobacteroides immunogenum]KPG07580.1 nitroreductase [Mycobacteroides immunogenum]
MGDKQKTPDWIAERGAWVLENGHRALLKLTGGRWPHKLGFMPTLELHTIGRKSGERRSSLLSSPIFTHERIVVIASLGGASHHPAWYLNLVANPNVEITVRGETKPYLARTASAQEKAELWPEITRGFGNPYAGYQRSTTRDIPVVICEPV